MVENLNSKIKSGLKWNMINQVFTQVIFVLFGLYLARLLGPKAYGLVGMVTVFSGIATLLVDFGFSSAIIYFRDLGHKGLSSIFWFNLFTAVLLYFILYIAAPYISDFYKEPRLTLLVRVISLSIIFSAFSAIHNALLSKDINFKNKTILLWAATICGYIVAFILAWQNYGVWSLVFQTIVSSVVNTVGLFFITKWMPLLHYSVQDIKKIFNYSSHIFSTNALQYATQNIDRLMIGKMAGNDALGIYTRATSLMAIPITNITQVFAKVLFPAFSSLQNNIPAMQYYYLRVIKIISVITFPLMFLFFTVIEEFTIIVLGNKWLGIIPVIKLFCLLGSIRSIMSLNGILYNSTGNAKIAFIVLLITNFIQIPLWYFSLKYWGFPGMIYTYTIFSIISSIPVLYTAIRLINLSLIQVFAQIKYIFFASITIIIINIFVISPIMYDNFNNWINLFVKLTIGSFVYLTLIYFLENRLILEYIKKLKKLC